MTRIPISFHRAQLGIYRDSRKIKVVCAGRRFGKTRLIIQDSVLAAMTFPGQVDPLSPETVLLTEPTLVMARQLLWQPLVNFCESPGVKPFVEDINRSEFKIKFKGNKPPLIVAGANDREGDGLRGKRLYRYYGDEFQDVKPGIFDTVIRPAMADTVGSRAMLTFTPKGTLNHTYELFTREKADPDTYRSFHARTVDNPFVPRSEVATAELTLPPRLFRQEFYASFEAFAGQIYSELSEANKVPGYVRVSDLPQLSLVVMGVDWGDVYPAIAVLGRTIDGQWLWLEGWQGDTGQPIPQPTFDSHVVRLASKWDVQQVFCDPSRPSSILGLRKLGTDYRLRGLRRAVAGYNRIEEGITQVLSLIYTRRLLFPLMVPGVVPDPKAGVYVGDDVYKLFEAYHRETTKDGQVTDKVAPGQFDHLLDACRYALAVGTGKVDEVD